MTHKLLQCALCAVLLAAVIFLGTTLVTAHRARGGVGQVNYGLPAWLIRVPEGTASWSTPGELAITAKFTVGSTKYVVMFIRLALALFLAMFFGLGLSVTGFLVLSRMKRESAQR